MDPAATMIWHILGIDSSISGSLMDDLLKVNLWHETTQDDGLTFLGLPIGEIEPQRVKSRGRAY